MSEPASAFLPTMFDLPSWCLAWQDYARSLPIKRCKWNFIPEISWKKRGPKRERSGDPLASTAAMLDVLRNQSCLDLSAETEPEECTAITTISDLSNAGSDDPDSEGTKQFASDSEPDTDLSAILSSILSISTASVQGHLTISDTAPKRPTSAVHRGLIYELPAPTEAHFCVYKRRTFLKFDKLGEPYFRIFEGPVDVSSLPPKEQNKVYENLLTSIVASEAPRSDLAGCTEKVLQHYHLHFSRLAYTRSTIRTLGLQHRTSAERSYEYKMSPWRDGLLRNWQTVVSAPRAFKMRAEQEREERGIMRLLDRCEEILKHDPGFRPVDWRPTPRKTRRWKDGRRGWRGLCADDVGLGIEGTARGGHDGRVRVVKVLKEAVCRVVSKKVGDRQRQDGVFESVGVLDMELGLAI